MKKSQNLTAVTGLEDWQPPCGIREWDPEWLPECSNTAEIAAVWHQRCSVALSCAACYEEFRRLTFTRFLEALTWRCSCCGESPVHPVVDLRAEAL